MTAVTTTLAPTAGPVRALLRDILSDSARWLPTVEFDAASRWYSRLDLSRYESELDVQAWLLSWLPGQRTGLHDHGGVAGGFAVARGSLREHSVSTTAADPARLLSLSRHAGQVRLFDANHIHEVVNVGDEPAVSVHLYSPTLTTMTRYRWTGRGPVVTAVERAGPDW